MAVQVQFRRGTKAQHDAFTGATAEVTVNTTDKTLVVHDGTTQGGFAIARADGTNLDLTGLAGVTTVTSVAIHGGTINNTTIGIGTSANGNFTNVKFVDGQVGSALSVGAATTFKEMLVVNGDARVTGILTVGTSSIIIDGDNEKIIFGGSEITGDGNINAATGIATYLTVDAGTLDAGANLYAVAGVVTTLTATNATTADLNVTADARVGSALTVTGNTNLNGNLTVQGNLDVQGSVTTIESTTVTVDDKNIELGSVDSPSDSTANGGGITLKGSTDKTITWQSDTGGWEVNQDFLPSADGTHDLGASGQEWQDLYVDGTANIDSLVADTADINAGTIDGTTIGGSSAAAGTFTNLTAADANITADARVGAALTVTGTATFQSNVNLGDNDRLRLGDSDDLQIYHDGSNSYILENGTGDLGIRGDNNFFIQNAAGTENKAKFYSNGAVELYYDNAKKIETTAYGVDVTGTTGTDGLIVSGVTTTTGTLDANGNVTVAGTLDVDGQAIFDDITVSAASTFAGDATFQSDIFLGDNDKLRLGDGEDLQIWHSGSNSFISDAGTGNLFLAGDNSLFITNVSASENKAVFTTNGSVDLYYDNSKKFETTGYGVNVTGTTDTDGLIVSGVTTTTGTLDANGNVTVAGTLDVDGQAIFDDITVSAASTFTGLLDANGGANISGGETVLSSATVSDLTDNRVVLAGTSGALEDSANLTFDGTTLAVTGNQTVSGTIDVDGQAIFDDITVSAASTFTGAVDMNGGLDVSGAETVLSSATVSDLTSGRVVLAGTSGAIEDSANLTFNGTTLSAPTADLTNATIDNLTFTSGTAITSVDTDLSSVSASDDTLASAKAIKTYVDQQVTAQDLDFAGGTGTGAVDLDSQTLTIAGTTNEIETSASGQTLTIGLPNDVTIGQDLTIGRDVLISRNLNVTGNVTIGGTSATIFASELKVADADIVLGVRTDGSGNDISNDTTADHGGVAVASTEGTPLVSIFNPGIGESNPATYKKIMWFKTGSFSGLGTDAWLSNYAIGIGSTQVPNNVVLAAGAVNITDTDISYVRDVTIARNSTVGGTFGVTGQTTLTGLLDANGGATIDNVRIGVAGNNEIDTSTGNLTIDSAGGTTTIDDALSVTGNISGNLANTLTLNTSGTGLSGSQTYNNSGAATFTVTSNATNSNTASTIVARDASGNFSAGTITATLSGNVTGNVTGAASQVTLADESTDTTCFPIFATTATGNQAPKTGTNLTFNSANGTLTATTFSGSGASLTSIPNGALTNSTISGVSLGSNLNTLTLNTSGTGLSGSQTYNGSGAATFTVTSNATSANTASAIVARDGSGNFSAGTITATLSGNATTATTATNANNINVADESTDTTCNVVFTTGATGNLAPKTGTNLTFNSANGTLSATTFSGSGASLTSIPNGALTNSTISGISLGSNLNTLTRGSYLTGSNYNGSSATTWAVDATSANTASKVVARDASGNFSAGTITATLSGNASSSTVLQTARTINGVSFNGSANITVEPYIEDDAGTNATRYLTFVDNSTAGYKRLNEDANLSYNPSSNVLTAGTFSGSGASLTSLNGSNITTGTIAAARVATLNQNTTGNAATATTLQTARTINGVSFNGSANITVESYIENDDGTNATRYITFVDNSTAGFKRLNEDTSLTYNPSSNTLTAGTVTATSDIKLKENITTIENGLDKVCQLRGVEFDFKSNGQHSLGVIAQEVEQVLPDLVSEVDGTKTVAYANLTAVLIEAVKELKAEVAELRSRLDG